MAVLTERNIAILRIIVEEYIKTWEVLGSKILIKKYDLWVSSATVRNDMAKLEKLDLVYQPYNSAGRLPTTKWLRAFVNYLMREVPDYFLQAENVDLKKEKVKNLTNITNKITFELAKNTREIAFFTIPEKQISEYSWIATFLKRNHKRIWDDIYNIIQMLEDKPNFIDFIKNFPINPWVNLFIWEENIIPYLKNYTIILKPIQIDWNIWYIWIIWCLKMDYSFNISAVRWII